MPEKQFSPSDRIEAIEIWPSSALTALSSAWINTADQLIGLSKTENGIAQIADLTSLNEAQVRDLLDKTAKITGVSQSDKMYDAVDTSRFGLGANPIDE